MYDVVNISNLLKIFSQVYEHWINQSSSLIEDFCYCTAHVCAVCFIISFKFLSCIERCKNTVNSLLKIYVHKDMCKFSDDWILTLDDICDWKHILGY